jgi:Mlc titration factor MtfA (ptsG expression regulator)
MLFTWLKRRRRRKLLAGPFPPAWLDYLHANVAHYRRLTEAEQAKLRNDLRILIAEKEWEGCGGQEITDEVKVTVAGQASLLLLGMRDYYFDPVLSILVYPREYLIPQTEPIGEGVVLEGEVAVEGVAHYRGPVILSWEETLTEGRDPGQGHNLVLHEFAHQLDMQDGELNGTPLIRDRDLDRRWQMVMNAEYEGLIADAEEGWPTLIDDYGTTNAGEFFAVVTECFFTRPVALRSRHRALYNLFRDYYRQDTAERFPEAQGNADAAIRAD